MAHWFHRNPLKATGTVGFDLKAMLTTTEAAKLCNDLRTSRVRLLELLTDPNNDVSVVDAEMQKYLTHMHGFLVAHDEKGGESKLRHVCRFRWTQSMLGFTPTELSDGWFDVLHMAVNVALWQTKHAAKLAGTDAANEQTAKEVHRCLRAAAGLFAFVKQERGRLNETAETGGDLDERVLAAYGAQTTAEAQEVTVARAIELSHTAALVSALAHETARLFAAAADALQPLDAALFGKWRAYLQLKHAFYLAYAYAYCGESLLAEDKCGDAIRACREAETYYAKAEQLCGEYSKLKGAAGGAVKPDSHLFFRRLKPILKRHLEKAERENGFIYHQKVPVDVCELEQRATYGLAKPEDFALPTPPADVWNARVYGAFDITRAQMPDFSKSKKGKQDLPPVKEAPVYQTSKDQQNHSGCTIS